jgi:undecaprenyl-diphosphatase
MPDWLSSVICGLVEGATEFIPVSSTGHLLIVEQWVGHKSDLFNVVIQCGAALALIPVFWRKLLGLIDFRDPQKRTLLLQLIVAFGITAVGCLTMKKFVPDLPDSVVPVAWATFIGGFVILAVEAWAKKRPVSHTLTWGVVIACAVGQIVAATFPGASRSGSCIIAAMLCGLVRAGATEFSFLLGLPTLLAAGAKEALDALKSDHVTTAHEWTQIGIGFIVAAVTAFIVVRWLLQFVRSKTLVGFAWYRIALGALLFLCAAKGWIH